MVSVSAPSCEVPMAVMVSALWRWAQLMRVRAYSIVMPGTVPGAGSRMMSAPAAVKSGNVGPVRMLSAAWSIRLAACILPAASTMLSPHGRLLNLRSVSMIAGLGHAHAGVAGEQDEVDAQLFACTGVFDGGTAASGHFLR